MEADRTVRARGMRVEVFDDYETLSQSAADIIIEAIRNKPDLLLCPATGSSPTRTYELLPTNDPGKTALFEQIRVLKLDEWYGLPSDDAGTCETYLRRHLLEPLHVSPDRYVSFGSDAEDPEGECARIGAYLDQQGPIDLCILGLGINGHLALNEPADALQPRPHVAELKEESKGHTMIAHTKVRPGKGLTLGIADILWSRKILLLVNGVHKRNILERLLSSAVSTQLPASFLLLHPDVALMCDLAAMDSGVM